MDSAFEHTFSWRFIPPLRHRSHSSAFVGIRLFCVTSFECELHHGQTLDLGLFNLVAPAYSFKSVNYIAVVVSGS